MFCLHIVLQSYTLRNGVLGMMGEILVRILSKEGLDSHQKAARDSFFDRLQVGVRSALQTHTCHI